MINVKHPWQAVPTELIEYAVNLSKSEDEFKKRTAFLLLDVGVETLFKLILACQKKLQKQAWVSPKRIKR